MKTTDIKPQENTPSVKERIVTKVKNSFDKFVDKLSAPKDPDREEAPKTPQEVAEFSTQQQINAANKGDRGIDR